MACFGCFLASCILDKEMTRNWQTLPPSLLLSSSTLRELRTAGVSKSVKVQHPKTSAVIARQYSGREPQDDAVVTVSALLSLAPYLA